MPVVDLDNRIAAVGDAVACVRRAILHVEVNHCEVNQLATLKQIANSLGTMGDVLKTDIAVRAAELRQVDTGNIVDTTLDPAGRSNPRDELVEKDRAGVLDNLPGLDAATRSGELSARYADIVAKALGKLSVDLRADFYERHHDLHRLAATMSEQAFRLHLAHLVERLLHDCGVSRTDRQRQQRKASTFVEDITGMFALSGRWDPLTGQQLNTAITAEVNAIYHTRRDNPDDLRTREQIMADAITNLICNTPTSSRTRSSHAAGATVVVITDHHTTTTGPHERSVHEYADGTPIAFDTLQALLDDPTTTIVEAGVNEHGVVQTLGDATLNHGRNRRCATPAQRLALRVMHRTCIFPGCDVPFDRCEQHHFVEWQHHGRTDLVELGPGCNRHHHRLHAHNWKLRVHPATRQLTITYPDGTTHTHPYTGLAPPGNDPPRTDGDPHKGEPGSPDDTPPRHGDDHPPAHGDAGSV